MNKDLEEQMLDELRHYCERGAGEAGFLPCVKQIANVAGMPGIVGASLGMPDIHSGYGFAIGNVAAIDMEDPEGVVSPGGVGFDINCGVCISSCYSSSGVRLIRTNLTLDQVEPVKEELTQALYDHIPVGVGSKGSIEVDDKQLDKILATGVDWAVQQGYAWVQDKEHCEEYGRMSGADPAKVSQRAKKRGMPQLGTLVLV